MMPVSKAAVVAAGTLPDAVDRQRFATALTCAVLYAIVVELVVKHRWEQEHASTALYPHLVLDNTRTALAFLDNPVTEGWP